MPEVDKFTCDLAKYCHSSSKSLTLEVTLDGLIFPLPELEFLHNYIQWSKQSTFALSGLQKYLELCNVLDYMHSVFKYTLLCCIGY